MKPSKIKKCLTDWLYNSGMKVKNFEEGDEVVIKIGYKDSLDISLRESEMVNLTAHELWGRP